MPEPSPTSGSPPAQRSELEAMRSRLVEALRRAEIISLLAAAEDEQSLGRSLCEELCEVFDAEVGLLVEREEGTWRRIGLIGAAGERADALLSSTELDEAAGAARALAAGGTDLLGVGARSALLAAANGFDGRRVVLGVGRMYSRDFEPPEVALLESVSVSAAQSLERLRAKRERIELIAQLKQAFVGTAEALANALEAKDNYTADHASEVADLAVLVGAELGLPDKQLEELRYGAIFHDIGKIAIPDAILFKPGPLSAEERRIIERHPEIGAEIVAPIPFLSDDVKAMVRHDHEHFDGSGYPDGLAGDRIPLGARIILVVDSFHAMISDRPYRTSMSEEKALEELKRCSGTQFDPRIVDAFARVRQAERA